MWAYSPKLTVIYEETPLWNDEVKQPKCSSDPPMFWRALPKILILAERRTHFARKLWFTLIGLAPAKSQLILQLANRGGAKHSWIAADRGCRLKAPANENWLFCMNCALNATLTCTFTEWCSKCSLIFAAAWHWLSAVANAALATSALNLEIGFTQWHQSASTPFNRDHSCLPKDAPQASAIQVDDFSQSQGNFTD